MVIAADEDIRSYQFFTNQKVWPRTWHGIKLLRGCEVDIVSPEGYLFGMGLPMKKSIVGDPFENNRDLYTISTIGLDFVIASVHGKWGLQGIDEAGGTQMYINVIEDPRVLMLGHLGRAGIPFDIDELLKVCKELNKPVEINEQSFIYSTDHSELCTKIAERCAELGVMICVNSDAHISTSIGKYKESKQMLDEIHFPEELVMNRSAQSFLENYYKAGFSEIDFSEED